MKKTSQLGFSIIFVLLAVILMISVYTVVLQRSYGCIAEEAAVARDTKRPPWPPTRPTGPNPPSCST